MKVKYTILFVLFVTLLACNAKKETEQVNYKKMGDSISAATFNHIKTALQNAISTGGPESAVVFCNEQAMGLTETLASDSVKIFRVAERYRNPANKLTGADLATWKKYQMALAKGDSIFAGVIDNDSVVDYYKPIILQPMCLTCHGVPQKNIPNALLHTIDSVYPGDLAKGFATGDLRGMWHIRFTKRL